MTTYATKRILSEAESRMTIQPDSGLSQAEHAELARIIKFMVATDYREAPPDADPELVAMIRRLDDSV